MSVADKVGESSSFGRARKRSDRGRAKAITEGSIPTYELIKLGLDQVSPTPLNPRRNFGTDEQMVRFGEELRQTQLAACVVVSRAAYLKLWPDHETVIGADALYVLVNGERRFRSALHVGIDRLDFVVRDDLAASREDFIDHLLAENLEREDFDVIERARGVQQLVDVCAEESGERGARSRAATRLGRDRSWVTNQLALLTLPEELQAKLSSGEVSERDGRSLARRLKDDPELDATGLLGHLASAKEELIEQRQEQQRLLAAGQQALKQHGSAGLLSADNKLRSTQESTSDRMPDESTAAGSLPADNEPAQTTALATDLTVSINPPSPEPSVPAQATIAETRDRPTPPVRRTPSKPAENLPQEGNASWQVPSGGWEPVFEALMAQMGELDRHRLTKRLNKVMEEELATAPQPSSP
ncbi:ParB/RepB/Spo0J family partition protein [Streptomyces sp. ADI95-17]|uniref:ParB/RepB/Spo0J family partition protein n=1 Tax=Streptomyces sp. ADI95-17 TaxID=1522759 RepID=UPI000F5C1F85|nr:ParB/RepB/Spo0J family partition protein [Streptomyces sp. ADI95-17]RPK55834.1 Chromosome-partitioning protein Spo0J [Streptomyces sp. ADI95-17]